MSSGIGCLAWLLLHWIGEYSDASLQLQQAMANTCIVNHKLLLSLGSGASLKMAVALLRKLAVTGSYVILKLYAAELFPTQIRCALYDCVKGEYGVNEPSLSIQCCTETLAEG